MLIFFFHLLEIKLKKKLWKHFFKNVFFIIYTLNLTLTFFCGWSIKEYLVLEYKDKWSHLTLIALNKTLLQLFNAYYPDIKNTRQDNMKKNK